MQQRYITAMLSNERAEVDMDLNDEVERIRRAQKDEAAVKLEARNLAGARAAEGQRILDALGRELVESLGGTNAPMLSRAVFEARRFSKGKYRVTLQERIWDLGVIAVSTEGVIGYPLDAWRPERPRLRGRREPSSPQQQLRNYRNPELVPDEEREMRYLLRREGVAGVYRTFSRARSAGTRPSGLITREDERYDIWFDGNELLHGTESGQSSFRDFMIRQAAAAITSS